MALVQLFLSTVSAEFRSYRDGLRHDLDRPNVTVKVQEDFVATGTETLDKLDEYIQHCDAVVHLVGDMTGAWANATAVAAICKRYPDLHDRLPVLSPFLAPCAPALSYTQWEAWLALYHEKVLIIAVPHNGAPRDAGYRLNADERASQQAHLARLASIGRYPEIRFANADRIAVDMLRSKLHDILALAPSSHSFRFWNVPDLPPNFVSRPDDFEAVKALLASPASMPVGVIGSSLKIGLIGMGGIGKSVLAVARSAIILS